VVQLMRAVLEEVAPWALIITETNVPHAENVRYFGHGDDEAHMVYNFPLPPLVLHSFLERDTTRLQEWARSLEQPGAHAAFFNFLASHDGVGLMPVRGLLTQSETDELIAAAQARGARISYKATSEGQIPYEINVNYLSGLTDPGRSTTERARQFLASQAVMLAFAGVPGIYLHSLIGSENYEEGVRRTGESRAINREQLNHETLRQELRSQDSLRVAVFQGFTRLLRARRREPAFHPTSPQEVLASDTRIVAIRRGRRPQSTDALAMNSDSPPLLCVHNVSAETVSARFLGAQLGIAGERASKTRELVNVAEGAWVPVHWEDETNFRIDVPPFGVLWLKAPSGSS
jgi:sucrose phosphorylase